MDKLDRTKTVPKFVTLVQTALNAMKAKSIPTLGSFQTPTGFTHRVTGRSRLHRGHVRATKKRQRHRAFYVSLRK